MAQTLSQSIPPSGSAEFVLEATRHLCGTALGLEAAGQRSSRDESTRGTFLHCFPDVPDPITNFFERMPRHF